MIELANGRKERVDGKNFLVVEEFVEADHSRFHFIVMACLAADLLAHGAVSSGTAR